MRALFSERRCPLVPEVVLSIADAITPLWEARANEPLPYWAVPWAGGQALARYVLDHPAIVAGKRVLDVGTGSGLVAIAAALAGGIVRAVDVDPRAIAAARDNATLSSVTIAFQEIDLLDREVDEEMILIGDLFYERELAARAIAFWERHPRALVGDPGRAYFPSDRCERLAEYEAEASADVEDRRIRAAGVYRMTR
ncbi:MAG: class I SAM-dependent methyltransferase [Polyangiales bacterium]